MNLFSNPKEINIGDQVFHEYNDKKALGTCIGFKEELVAVDYTTELSTEQKIDNFPKGFWSKQI